MTDRGTNVDTLERVGFALIAASLGLVQLSIVAGQGVLFTLAALVWLALVIRERRWPATPAFFLPLAVYAGLTLVSAALSLDPPKSLIDSRQLLLILMVPIVARLARGPRATTTIDVIIAIGSAGALVGIVQFAILGFDNLNARPHGLLGHYMTYSGVLMLVTGAAAARLLFHPKEWIWPAVALPALLAALAFTFGRAAYVGMFFAICVLLALRNWRLLLIVPVAAVVALLISPPAIRARVYSAFDSQDATRRDRVAMLHIGRAIVQDYPMFGVGPEMIETVYPKYRPPTAVNPTNPHLHNVPMQIAAERGLLALGAWLWFVVVALRDSLRQVRHGPARPMAAAACAAIVGMLGAGLLEYNFGDSEFFMLLLGLMTLPFAAAAGDRKGATS